MAKIPGNKSDNIVGSEKAEEMRRQVDDDFVEYRAKLHHQIIDCMQAYKITYAELAIAVYGYGNGAQAIRNNMLQANKRKRGVKLETYFKYLSGAQAIARQREEGQAYYKRKYGDINNDVRRN